MNKEILNNERYYGIDLFKFIMCIFVVAIHTNPLVNNTNNILNTVYSILTGMAVPFFFLTSVFCWQEN